ncbi:MAG: cytochrome c biogenesis protein CcdA [Sneathiellaceae bacterium]
MSELQPMLQEITALTPYTIALVALAGLVVGVAPSSFPLISVAVGLAAGQGAVASGPRRIKGLWLSAGFVLGIVTIDTLLGAAFGFAGFAVLRVLASHLALIYFLLAGFLFFVGLALLRIIHVAIPTLAPSARPTRSFVGSYLLGLPFGLSTCPACTPMLFPVVAATAATGSPLMGAVLMATFGIARGIPIIVAATVAGSVAHFGRSRAFILWAERIGAVLMFAAALYFLVQAVVYAGWLRP